MSDHLWDATPLIYDAAKQPCYASVRDELINFAQEIQAIHDRYFNPDANAAEVGAGDVQGEGRK